MTILPATWRSVLRYFSQCQVILADWPRRAAGKVLRCCVGDHLQSRLPCDMPRSGVGFPPLVQDHKSSRIIAPQFVCWLPEVKERCSAACDPKGCVVRTILGPVILIRNCKVGEGCIGDSQWYTIDTISVSVVPWRDHIFGTLATFDPPGRYPWSTHQP